MARRIRLIGTDSKVGECPTLYEDVDTGEIIVQGDVLTDPDDLAQMQNVREGEGFLVIPRSLLVNHAPKA
jgi:hypothetical protein